MSVDHTTIQLALQARLLTLLACTTGRAALSATATGYHRATGSFVSDNFAAGMEVTPLNFASTTTGVVTAVTDTDLTIKGGRAVESVAAGRELLVGLPPMRAWENTKFKRDPTRPFVEEQYVPGPAGMQSDGYGGLLELLPMYSPRIYVPGGGGIAADGHYADAMLRLFAPGTTLPLITGEAGTSLVVRGDPAPVPGQRHTDDTENWSVVPISIWLRVTTMTVPALL